jgi:hypothetical protein
MSAHEFDEHAAQIAEQLPALDLADRIAAACRGSGNPAALAWLAESLHLSADAFAVDLGAGLGGPARWLSDRFGWSVVAVEPAAGAIEAAASVFGVLAVRASAGAAPFAADSFDVALLLGVLSVAAEPDRVLAESRRIAPRLGVLDYCATGSSPVQVGGSSFLPADDLAELVASNGWNVLHTVPASVPAPRAWRDAADGIDVEHDASESEVIAAIEAGRLAPVMLVAER